MTGAAGSTGRKPSRLICIKPPSASSPIERAVPVLALHHVPAVGEPQRRRGVAAILDEGDPLGVGHAAVGELEGADQRLVARAFIVIGEAFAVMADVEDAAVEGDEVERRRVATATPGPARAISGLQRLAREQAQNIGEQKLLMLLLVIDAELDQRPPLPA